MRRLSGVIVFLCLAVAAGSVAAFIPDADRIVGDLVSNYRKVEDLSYTKKDIVYDPASGSELTSYSGKGYFLTPDKFRDEVNTPSSNSVTIVNGQRRVYLVDGQKQVASPAATSPALFFLLRPKSEVLDALKSLSISTDIVGFGRLDGRICYTIGVPGEGHDGPQLWIDREMEIPLRLVVPKKDGTNMRIEFRDWDNSTGKIDFPRRIFFYDDQGLSREWRIEKIEINTGIKSALFAIGDYFNEPKTSDKPSGK